MTWFPYTTQRPHGAYPAGTQAKARVSPHNPERFELRFPNDPFSIFLDRSEWTLPGTPLASGHPEDLKAIDFIRQATE
jgi:hypothetical protein